MAAVSAPPSVLPSRPGLTEAKLKVLRAAVELFGEHGFHGVSVRMLADRLGVKPPALYAHVDSKQDLLLELVTIGHEEHRDRLRDALLESSADPADQVHALVHAHVTTHLMYPALARVSHREIGALEPEHHESLQAIVDESARLFADVIERGCRLEVFDVEDAELAVAGIAAMGVRAADWWTPQTGTTATHVADTFAGYALRILGVDVSHAVPPDRRTEDLETTPSPAR